MNKFLLAAGLFLVFAHVVYANSHKLEVDEIVLPPLDSINGPCKLCFYSDTSGIGHGFMKIRTPDGKWRGYGFHPTGKQATPLCDQGVVRDDGEHVWNHKICFEITAEECKEAFKTVDDWRHETYYLLAKNCVNFINEVARRTKQPIPSGGWVVQGPQELDSQMSQSAVSRENKENDRKEDTDPDTGKPMKPERQRAEALKKAIEERRTARQGQCSVSQVVLEINKNAERIPQFAGEILRDQRVNFVLNAPTGGVQKIGVVFEGVRVKEVGAARADATLTIESDVGTVNEIAGAGGQDEIISEIRKRIKNGGIKIIPHTSTNRVAFSAFDFINRLDSLINPPKRQSFAIAPGETRRIVFNGRQGTLATMPTGIAAVAFDGSRHSVIVNSRGDSLGFMPATAARVLAAASTRFTRGAGIYVQPGEALRGWSNGITQLSSFRYTPPSTAVVRVPTSSRDFLRIGAAEQYGRANVFFTGAALGGVVMNYHIG